MELNELHERVAVLESKMDTVNKNQDDILIKLTNINDSLTKYRGFVGGIMFVATAIWTFITFGKDYILKHWN